MFILNRFTIISKYMFKSPLAIGSIAMYIFVVYLVVSNNVVSNL